jgi:hypothetical protein
MAMSQPADFDNHEGESSVLDTLTRQQLDQAAIDYNENKQVTEPN